MKLNIDLMRKILLGLEEIDLNGKLAVEGHPPQEISYHVALLADGEYVEARESPTVTKSKGRTIVPQRLTLDGHDLLDLMRDADRLEKAKEYALRTVFNEHSFELVLRYLRTKASESP